MAKLVQTDGGGQRRQALGAGAVLRYSAIFAAITVPAYFVMLALPAILLATWIIARLFAQRYRRQIAAKETFLLALASWAWLFAANCLHNVALDVPPLTQFDLAFEALSFGTVWAAYVWLARFVIRRKLGLATGTGEAQSAQEALAQQEDRYAEAIARSVTLGVGWLTVGGLGIIVLLILLGIVAQVLTLAGVEIGGAFGFYGLVLGLPALMAGWAYFIQRKTSALFPSHRLVLWLRRFHRKDLLEFPFPAFLERVCRGVAVPITLQDSTVVTARTAAQLRPSYYALTALFGVSWFAFCLSTVLFLQSDPGFDLETLLRGIVPALALVALIAVPIFIPHLGVVRLDTTRGRRLVQRLMDAIESREGVPQTLTIVSTPDDAWQYWVLRFLKHSDAVIIDVTHLSESLHWELRQLALHLRPQQLILAYAAPEGSEAELPPELQAELASVLGESMVEESQRFFYELPLPRWWRKLRASKRGGRGWMRPTGASERRYARQLVEALHVAFAASHPGRTGKGPSGALNTRD
jgi:hypothetical protein